MEAKRREVETLIRAGHRNADIADIVKVNVRTVQRVRQRVNVGEGMERRRGSGGRRVLSKRQVAGLLRSVKAKPTVSMRKRAKDLGVGDATVCRYVNNAGFKSYKRRRRPLLTSKMKAKRLERCKLVLNLLKKGGNPIIVFSDEKTFVVDQKQNAQNDRVLVNVNDDNDDKSDVSDDQRFIGQHGRPMPPCLLATGFPPGGSRLPRHAEEGRRPVG